MSDKKLISDIRKSKKYEEWKSKIFKRDNEVFPRLQIHHNPSLKSLLKKYNITTLKEAEDCEELWKTDIGYTITQGEHYVLSLLERTKNHTKSFKRLLKEISEKFL